MNHSGRAIWLAVARLVGAIGCAAAAGAQAPEQPPERPTDRLADHPADSLPFACGERLTFRVRTAKLGTVGHAVMTITGPVDIRGTETVLASFDASAGIAFMKGGDKTRSWFDLRRMTSLRFEKHEKRPFSSNVDSVEIYPELHRWEGVPGDSGTIASDVPLDELSFIYFLRTLSFAPDTVYSFDRHYDSRRMPTSVRVVRRETLKTPAGEFSTVELEMRAKGGESSRGDVLLRLWISDDRCRLLVRVESAIPLLGNGIMTLESVVAPSCPNLGSK
jgi:uncharacterized protein DUF3108